MLRGSFRRVDRPLRFALCTLGATIAWFVVASLWGALLTAIGPGVIMLLITWVLGGIGIAVTLGNRLFSFASKPLHEGTFVLAIAAIALMALSWLGDRAIAYFYAIIALTVPAFVGAYLASRVFSLEKGAA